jgi:hypothetical protein
VTYLSEEFKSKLKETAGALLVKAVNKLQYWITPYVERVLEQCPAFKTLRKWVFWVAIIASSLVTNTLAGTTILVWLFLVLVPIIVLYWSTDDGFTF